MSALNRFFLSSFLFFSLILSTYAAGLTVIGNTEVKFGTFPVKDRQEHSLEIENKGDIPYDILEIRQFCNCTEVNLTEKKINPGQRTKLTVSFKPYSLNGFFDKRIFLHTNDPSLKLITIAISGDAKPLVIVKPESNFYPKYFPIGIQWEQPFSLFTEQTGVELGPPQIESNYPLDLTLLSRSATEKGEMIHYVMRFTPLEVGPDLQAAIRFPLLKPDGWQPVTLTVKGKIGLTLYPFPVEISFSDEESKSATAINKSVTLKLLGAPNARINAEQLRCTQVTLEPGTVKGIQLPCNLIFSPEFLAKLRESKQETIRISYPESNTVDIRCVIQSP